MRVALLGGTGAIGEGLALRFAYHTDHEVVVGSREVDRARTKADGYETELDSRGVEVTVGAGANAEAVVDADVVVLAVPPYHVRETVDAVADPLPDGAVLVTPCVGMRRDEGGLHYDPPGVGSVTELVAETAPEGAPVVGAYHNLPAGRLADLDADLGMDTVLVADDEDAKETVRLLTAGVPGLRALDGGPLSNAPEVESVTPLLVTLADHNDGLHDLGVRFG